MSFDVKAALELRETLLAELREAGTEGVRITSENVVTAAYLIAHDQAHAFLNGFGYLCLSGA